LHIEPCGADFLDLVLETVAWFFVFVGSGVFRAMPGQTKTPVPNNSGPAFSDRQCGGRINFAVCWLRL